MVTNVKNLISKIDFRYHAILILTLYLCTFFVYTDFGIPAIVGVVFLFLYLVIEMIQAFFIDKINISKIIFDNDNKYIFVVLCIILLFSLLNFSLDTTKIFYILIAIISIGMIVLGKSIDKKTLDKVSIIFIGIGVLFSILILFFRYAPELYQNLIFPFLSTDALAYIARTTSEGYSISVGGEMCYTVDIIIIGIIFLLYTKKIDKEHLLNFLLLFIMIVSTLFSQRRAETLMLMLILLLFLLHKYNIINKLAGLNKKYIIIGFGIFVVVCLIGYLMIPTNLTTNNRILQTLVNLKNGTDVSNGRGSLYSVALKLFKKNPIIGIGWMNFSKFAIETGNTHARNVHCIYLQLLTECGVLGATGFLYCLIYYIKDSFKLIKINNYIFICLSLYFFILVDGIIDNTIYYPYFWVIFMIVHCVRISFNTIKVQ